METNFAMSDAHRGVTNKVALIPPRHLSTSRDAKSKRVSTWWTPVEVWLAKRGQYKDAWKLGGSFWVALLRNWLLNSSVTFGLFYTSTTEFGGFLFSFLFCFTSKLHKKAKFDVLKQNCMHSIIYERHWSCPRNSNITRRKIGNKHGKVIIRVVHTCVDKEIKHITKPFRKANLGFAYKTKNILNTNKTGNNRPKWKNNMDFKLICTESLCLHTYIILKQTRSHSQSTP